MWRTMTYRIWPRDLRFEEGLLGLPSFAEKRTLVPSAGRVIFDNAFTIVISGVERVRCESCSEFLEVLRRTPVFTSFSCSPFFSDNQLKRYLRTGVSFN